MLLAIDPSVISVGAALFHDNGVLHDAWYVRPGVIKGEDRAMRWRRIANQVIGLNADNISILVSEVPQIYQRQNGKTKGDPNELLGMVGVVGALAATLQNVRVVTYLPSEWKGQLDKATMCRRVLDKLTPGERMLVPLKSHDAIDAVGVGLYHLGRLDRVRVFPGATQPEET